MRKIFSKLFVSITLIFILTACGIAPRVMAEQRMFLDLSLEFLGEYQIPKQTFQNTTVGGLSGITYDRKRNRFYAVSDDRSQLAPARFYTLNLNLNRSEKNKVSLDRIEIEKVTFLKNERGETYSPGTVDCEGIALSARGTLFISSEGAIDLGIPPFIGEFDLNNGQLLQTLRIPQRYLPELSSDSDAKPRGIQNNLGFEALMIAQNSIMKDDPFRLFTATESALVQDSPPETPQESAKIRLMHYVINPIGEPVLVGENFYLLDAAPSDVLSSGLSELTALEKEGYSLSLERTFGLSGFGAKIFQVVNANATDTSLILSFQGDQQKIVPLKKKLLLDLSELGIELDNLEGMTLGTKLPDGSQTLWLVSDDNFKDGQVTQFLLFRLVGT
jgi:hypothetical protein